MNEQERQQMANFRYGLIAPLVSRKLEAGEQMGLMRDIVSHVYETPTGEQKRISLRTLERYVQAYRSGGWEALLPSLRADKLQTRDIPEDVLTKAIALKPEQPGRSIRQIIAILELAQFVNPGVLKESTLSKQLRRRGMTRKVLLTTGWSEFRRFEALHRNSVWQGDVQHTLYLPHPDKPGKKAMAYLVIFIDDYSRLCVHGQFYFEERIARLEDCLKKAILKHGVPEMIYVDNGAIYSSHHFGRICGRLGTELKHTRPGRPQGRGKQEKFFRFVDQSFVPEAYDLVEQGKIQTLTDLNRFFAAWLEVAYHQKVHNSFKQRPIDRYQKDEHPIRTMPPHELAEVFLLEESRKADKTGCISLLGTTYEVETKLAGSQVQVRFDPHDLSLIQVWKDGVRWGDAKPLVLRDPKQKRKAVEPALGEQQPPKTGLNYVELTTMSAHTNIDLQVMMELDVGQPIEYFRTTPIDLGSGKPRAFLSFFSANYDIDASYQMFCYPKDTLKMFVYTEKGDILWKRDLGPVSFQAIRFATFSLSISMEMVLMKFGSSTILMRSIHLIYMNSA